MTVAYDDVAFVNAVIVIVKNMFRFDKKTKTDKLTCHTGKMYNLLSIGDLNYNQKEISQHLKFRNRLILVNDSDVYEPF